MDNADTANKGNKKSRQINGLVNEWYLEDMSENIRSVLTNRRQNGLHIGAFALYGYKKDPERKGHLIIDAEAAAVVREVFTLFSQGYGKTAIARMLNDRGIPNPTEYKRLQGIRYQQPKGKSGTLWKYFAISDMLRNEMYIGNMVQGKYGSVSYKSKQNKPRPKEDWYRVENTHEAIIDPDLWNRVQTLLNEHTHPFETGTVGLFARKAFCINCGYTMRSTKSRGVHYLTCSNRHVSKDACVGAFISIARLEEIVIEELRILSSSLLDLDVLEQNIELCNTINVQRERLSEELETYHRKIGEFTDALRNLYLDKVRGVISECDFRALSEEFSRDRVRYERLLSEGLEHISELEGRISVGENRRAIIEQYTDPKHLSREMVELMIDHITVGKRAKGEKDAPVVIYWDF